MKKKFPIVLLKSLKHSINQKNVFSSSMFFLDWFKNHGISYFFLFKKNLRVTNIQFAELISLLRSHIYNKNGQNIQNQLQFVNQTQFKSTVQNIVDSLLLDKRPTKNDYKLFSKK